MTVCRASWLAGALLMLLGGAAAHAQDAPAPPAANGAPQTLSNGGDATAPSAPATTSPQTLPGSDEASPPGSDAAPVEFKPGILGQGQQKDVTANDLGIVDGPPVGTLDDSNGGLGQGMWANARREEVEDLLGRIPLVSADPFVHALARRVVLTTSESPVGPAKRALVTIRIEKLLQAGMVSEAGAIAAGLTLNGDADFARVQADALLYAGRDKDVCSDLTSPRLTSAEPFWLQLRLWCFAASGDMASAELTRAVLDAQGATDKAFDILVADASVGVKTPPGDVTHPTALHIYLLRRAGFPVTAAIAARLGTSAAAMAVRDLRNSPAERLAAATRISQTGALTANEITATLNSQPITSDQIARAGDLAAKLPFLPAQSLLRRAAKLETRPNEKAALLALALSADGHPDRLTLTALLHRDLIASITPSASLALQRNLFARALVLDGRADAAEAWYAGAAADVESNLFQILLNLAATSAKRSAVAQAAMSALAASVVPPQTPTRSVTLALGLSDVLGDPMPPDAKTLAATMEGTRTDNDGRRPSADDMRKLEEASSQPGRKGEAVLRILDIIGANGPFDLPPDVTIECVRILQQLGLTGEARQLAIEALALQPSAP